MERYIGLDTHAASCTLAVISEAPSVSYAPPKNRTKRWPTEAQMEGWFPPACGERDRCPIAERGECETPTARVRPTRAHACRPGRPREAETLHSRPQSLRGGRRRIARSRANRRGLSCNSPLWKEA